MYKEFKVEALSDHTSFRVFVKGWLFWKSGYVYTNYFGLNYDSEEKALEAIKGYKNRFTHVDTTEVKND